MIWLLLLAIPLLIAAVVALRARRQRQARTALLATRLPAAERETVERLVPLITRMPPDLRAAHEGKMALLLDQVDFYGEGGLEVTRDMRLSVAAQACVLVAGNDNWFTTLRTVLLYPGAFRSRQLQQLPILRLPWT